jgi:hypothetical protein
MSVKEGYIIVSDNRENIYKCIVLTSGIDTTDYLRNPVMLLNHDPNILLGAIEDLHVFEDQLIGKPVFDNDNAEASKWKGKWERGYLKASSVDLDIKETEVINGKLYITKSTLCEVSLTPVPGNKNALRLTRNGKSFGKDDVKILLSANSISNTMNKLQLMAKALGLSLTASEDDVLSKIEALVESANAKADELNKLKLAIKEKEDAAAAEFERQCIQLIDNAASVGKISKDAATKETYLRFAKADFAGTKKMLDGIAEHVSLSSRINNSDTPSHGDDRSGWSLKDWEKKDSHGLRLMKKSNPDQYNALLAKLSNELKTKGALA